MSTKQASLLIKDRPTAIVVGVALTALGSYILYDAFEKRGKGRPFALKFIPGP